MLHSVGSEVSEVSEASEDSEGSVEGSVEGSAVVWVDLYLGSVQALAYWADLEAGWDAEGDFLHDVAEPWPLWAWGLV